MDRAVTIKDLVQRRSGMDAEYSVFEPHFRELRDWIQPTRGRFSLGEARNKSTLNKKIIDSTARRGLRTLKAGLMSGITSPSRAWFKLGLYDESAMDDPDVKRYMHTVETRMYAVLRGSNVYRTLDACYTDLGLFGTFGGMIIGDFDDVVRSYGFQMGLYRIGENERGDVDVLHRDVPMTVKQVVEKFGIENCSSSVQNLYTHNRLYVRVEVCHAIERRMVRDPKSPLGTQKPVASYYWEKSESGDKFLSVSGFGVNPILAPRWEAVQGDAYSVSSPGMDALGDAVQLQGQHIDKATAIKLSYKPPMQAPAGFKKRMRLVPGGMTTVDSADLQKGGLRPIHEVRPTVADRTTDIYETQQRIRSAFFEDLFLMTAGSDRRQVTATEIAERHQEKLLVLGPVLESLDHGLLQPIISATFHYMQEAGILPPPPEAMQGKALKVEYISLLAQAQRAVGVAAIERTIGFAGSLAQVKPEVLDGLNADEALREFSDQVGPPPKILHSEPEIQAIRQQRAQAAQQQAAIDSAQPLAGAAKLISEAGARGQEGLERQRGAL